MFGRLLLLRLATSVVPVALVVYFESRLVSRLFHVAVALFAAGR